MQTLTKQSIPAQWQKLLRQIPNYDPIETAGDCTFDVKAAQLVIDFFSEHLVFIEGEKASQPFILENWQKSILANLFGWFKPDGLRRYREAFIEVGRKNGKTPFCAGIVDYMGFCDNEPGAQIYAAAAEREQAGLLFRHAAGMIDRNKDLQKRSRVHRSFKSIEFYDGTSFFRALSAEAETKHGYNSHCVIIDELHAQPNRELVDVLMTSTGSRRQPLIIHITTAGFDRETICYEKYDYACKVRDGIIEDVSFLPVVYESLAEADWKSEETWKQANPNLGVSISPEYLRRECQRAQDSPVYENTFRRLHLNQWTESDVRWINFDKWMACAGKYELENLKYMNCFAGLDLSTTTDFSAFVMIFSPPEGIVVLPKFWLPKENLRKRQDEKIVSQIRMWAKDGFIELTEGDVIDHDIIRKRINEFNELYSIKEIAIDRWNAAQITTQLQSDGFDIVPFGQGFASMSAPTKELESLVLQQKLIHLNNPVLNWMASNVSVEIDAAGNIKPSKKKSKFRIDGIVSLIMAIGRLIAQPSSIYEERGILLL